MHHESRFTMAGFGARPEAQCTREHMHGRERRGVNDPIVLKAASPPLSVFDTCCGITSADSQKEKKSHPI